MGFEVFSHLQYIIWFLLCTLEEGEEEGILREGNSSHYGEKAALGRGGELTWLEDV